MANPAGRKIAAPAVTPARRGGEPRAMIAASAKQPMKLSR
jgi:hypothetical protein